jgi:hypothetical protein
MDEIEALLEGQPHDLLDDAVHDAKGEEAAAINNAGPPAQITYLMERGWTIDDFRAAIEEAAA